MEVLPSQAGAYTEPVQSSTATIKACLQIPNEFYTCKGEKGVVQFLLASPSLTKCFTGADLTP